MSWQFIGLCAMLLFALAYHWKYSKDDNTLYVYDMNEVPAEDHEPGPHPDVIKHLRLTSSDHVKVFYNRKYWMLPRGSLVFIPLRRPSVGIHSYAFLSLSHIDWRIMSRLRQAGVYARLRPPKEIKGGITKMDVFLYEIRDTQAHRHFFQSVTVDTEGGGSIVYFDLPVEFLQRAWEREERFDGLAIIAEYGNENLATVAISGEDKTDQPEDKRTDEFPDGYQRMKIHSEGVLQLVVEGSAPARKEDIYVEKAPVVEL